jgi:hypothetical protein
MKKTLLILISFCLLVAPCQAALKVVGKGDKTSLDPTRFPPAMRSNYEIMKVKCVKCHSLERTVVAIQTGIAPISGQPFDRNAARAYGVKMMRKPDSNMNKPEVKAVIELLNYLIDESAQ